MRNRNLLILLIALVFIGAAFALAHFTKDIAPLPDAQAPSLAASATPESQATEAPADPTTAPETAESSIKAWLVVTVGGTIYQPLALDAEGEFTLTQKDSGAENIIHVTPDSVRMKSSTCDNQDCVEQGVVSLENKDERVLQNMIICLPNQVSLQLYTTEELAALMEEGDAQ